MEAQRASGCLDVKGEYTGLFVPKNHEAKLSDLFAMPELVAVSDNTKTKKP